MLCDPCALDAAMPHVYSDGAGCGTPDLART